MDKWSLKVESGEQFNEVLNYFKSKGLQVADYHRYPNRGDWCPYFAYENNIKYWGYNYTDNDSEGRFIGFRENRISWEQFQQLKQPKMDYTIPGTKIPKALLINKKYLLKDGGGTFTAFSGNAYDTSYGIKVKEGVSYLAVDRENYKGDNWILFRLDQFDFSREIVGYDLIDKKNEKVARRALAMASTHTPFIIKGSIHYYLPKIEELGIMDWFEPVYAPTKPTFKEISLGNPARKFIINKEEIQVIDGSGKKRFFNNEHLYSLAQMFTNTAIVSDYNVSIKTLHIGCDAGTELSHTDLQTIKSIQNEL